MLGCFNPILVQIRTNPNVGLKMSFKNVTQWVDLSIFETKVVQSFVKTTQHFLECIRKKIEKKKTNKLVFIMRQRYKIL